MRFYFRTAYASTIEPRTLLTTVPALSEAAPKKPPMMCLRTYGAPVIIKTETLKIQKSNGSQLLFMDEKSGYLLLFRTFKSAGSGDEEIHVSIVSALIGTSTVIRHVQHLVMKFAESEAPVLLTGEPGTGKELVARSIHEKSARASGPFVPLKCGAIGEDLLEAELFGHEKGAFAGAHSAREGRISVASGGTLFLEEVARLSPKLQAQLLKVLQEGVSAPLGSTQYAPVNVRIICSTSVNIDQAVRERMFREDLYYRLAGCAVYIPPLRERREDIAPLVEHFTHKYNQAKGKNIFGVSPDAMSALLQAGWAHNIRELENLVERIVVLKNSGSIEVCDLPPRLRNLVTDNIDAFYERSREVVARPVPGNTAHNSNNANNANNNRLSGNGGNGGMNNGNAGMNSGMGGGQNGFRAPANTNMNAHNSMNYAQQSRQQSQSMPNFGSSYPQPTSPGYNPGPGPGGFEDGSEIDQFIKKEIDLGSGIDFYRVVEEFENRLIAEALRRTNHNKNRAAQLLSMNRTTLVEKLKKRAASSSVKVETGRVKRNPAFTIFDGLGAETRDFDVDFISTKGGNDFSDTDFD